MKKATVICTTLLVEKSPQALPLGAACIASAVKNNPATKDFCTVKLKAFSLEDSQFAFLKNDDEKAGFIADSLLELFNNAFKNKECDENLKICCFSVFVWNRIILEKAGIILQQKGIYTLAGGPEVTANPYSLKTFDFAVSGEGEDSVPAVISNLISDKTAELPGKAPVKVIPRSSAPDTKTLFSPYLDGTLDPAEYCGALWELARGCPFKCSYCYESKGEKTVRMLPMERIEKELDLFAQKKVPQVFVLDPTYNANKNRALEMLKLIAKKTPETFYYFEARAEFLDAQLAQAFTKIPCALQIGLQSANEEVLKKVNRPFNRKAFVKGISFLNNYGVVFGLDLIYGLPGETLKTFKEGIDFAASLYPNNLEIFCLSVLPGTDLYERAEELNLTFEEKPPYHVLYTDRFSAQDLNTARKLSLACTLFYNNGRAVPWFNTICSAARIRPSAFFNDFYNFIQNQNSAGTDLTAVASGTPAPEENKSFSLTDHKKIEDLQKKFVKQLFEQKNLASLTNAAVNLISFNGAISRVQDTGKEEILQLNFDPEYLASEYSTDLAYFSRNVRPKNCRVRFFKQNGAADFSQLK